MLGGKKGGMGRLEGERREEEKVGEKKGVTSQTVLSVASLIVSLLAFVFSIFAYYNTTVPHSRFEEVKTRLDVTWNLLNTTEKILNRMGQEATIRIGDNAKEIEKCRTLLNELGESLTKYKEKLQEAKDLYYKAQSAWLHGDYDSAEKFLKSAYGIADDLRECITVPAFSFEPVQSIISVIAALLMILALGLFVVKRRP
jgi:hypothetical protein